MIKFKEASGRFFFLFLVVFEKMYRINKNILHSFQADFKILVKSDILEEFSGSFPGVSRVIREVSHVHVVSNV